MLVYLIEDDRITAESWVSHIEGELEGSMVVWFDHAYEAWLAAGNPDCIIFDVGSIGLDEEDEKYFHIFEQIREKFPHCWIYLTSGMPCLPDMIMEEYGEHDKLIKTLKMGRCGPALQFIDHWNKYK